MSNHLTSIAGGAGAWQGRCSCRQTGEVTEQRWAAEDWVRVHTEAVAQARAHLARIPSLRSQHAYYIEMSEALDTPEEHRAQWAALAAGIRPRMDQTDPRPETQPGLW